MSYDRRRLPHPLLCHLVGTHTAQNEAPISRGYGITSTATKPATAVTEDTPFMIASVSKVFAGAAIAVLLDQGFIQSLDDSICSALPGHWTDAWKKQACENPHPECTGKKVTWRMLATHRSSLVPGIPDVEDIETGDLVSASYGPENGYDGSAKGNEGCPLDDVTGFYRDIMIDKETETTVGTEGLETNVGTDENEIRGKVNWREVALKELGPSGVWNANTCPGGAVDYSNFAIGYIAALVEYVTGDSFDTFVNEEIFDVLNMKNTKWFHGELKVPYASPHVYDDGAHTDIGAYCFIDYASGQLWTTAKDMTLFMNEMLSLGIDKLWKESTSSHVFGCQEKDEDNRLVEHSNCEFALTFQLLNNAMRAEIKEKADSEDAFLKEFQDLDFVHGVMHSGGEEGVLSQLVILPRSDAYAFVVLNTSTGPDAEAEIMTKFVIQEAKKLANSQA